MPSLPTVRLPRLTLVPVDAGDEDAICALLRDEDVRRYRCDGIALPREQVRQAISESLDPASMTAFWRLSAADFPTVGLIGVRPPSAAANRLRPIGWRSLELVVALGPASWGRGLATEAVGAVAEIARADGVTFALVASVDEPNTRSHALMRRCGFQELGRAVSPAHGLVVYELAL